METSGDITLILQRWDSDRLAAVEALTPIVYKELHRIASNYLRRHRSGHTLQPTALINEAYLRLIKQESATLRDRSHFYALCSRMMRGILADSVRAHLAEKRGSGNKVQLDEKFDLAGPGGGTTDFLVIHEALGKLQAENERIAQVVELRYFAGLQHDEIAEAVSISLATVKRDLALGEAWLRRALSVG